MRGRLRHGSFAWLLTRGRVRAMPGRVIFDGAPYGRDQERTGSAGGVEHPVAQRLGHG